MLHNFKNKIKDEIKEQEAIRIMRYVEPLNYHHTCPCCGSVHVVRNGTYSRNVVFIHRNRLRHVRVRLQRFLCRKCNKTRTHYPDFLVPRKEYSLGTLLVVLLTDKGNNKMIEKILIPESQVREIKRKYRLMRKKINHIVHIYSISTYKDLMEKYEYEFAEKMFNPINEMCT